VSANNLLLAACRRCPMMKMMKKLSPMPLLEVKMTNWTLNLLNRDH